MKRSILSRGGVSAQIVDLISRLVDLIWNPEITRYLAPRL